MIRWASVGLILAALSFLAIAVYSFWTDQPQSDEPSFIILDTDKDLGQQPIDGIVVVKYEIKNRGTRAIRIVGCEGGGCGKTCCFGPKTDHEINNREISIAPGETLDYLCELMARLPGPILWDMTIFIVDDNGLHSVKLSVHGTAISAGTEHKDKS